MTLTDDVLLRVEQLVTRVETLLPAAPEPIDWSAIAHRWRRHGHRGSLRPVRNLSDTRISDLLCIDDQKASIDTNTRQFIAGLPANHVLLWGPRGTGKSSLIKALLNEYAEQALRLLEIERDHLGDLPEVVDLVAGRKERFIIFCDDLSFEGRDTTYKALKVLLDGSIQTTPSNVLLYATSNRRHLLPERQRDNLDAYFEDDELHQSEAVEERISLSERFGIWLAFHPFTQEQYLHIVNHWLDRHGIVAEDRGGAERAALQWALLHGSRSGRAAWQFAKDWAGQYALART